MFINTFVDAGREFFYLDTLSAPFSTSLQFSTMADPSTGRMIIKAIHASLRLVSNSPELLTLSQLYVSVPLATLVQTSLGLYRSPTGPGR